MEINYQMIKGNKETFYLKESVETQLKSNLLNWDAMIIYDLMKVSQTPRFLQLLEKKELIDYINKMTQEYLDKMEIHLQNGWMEIEAKEVEWWNLCVMVGIEDSSLRTLPTYPPLY